MSELQIEDRVQTGLPTIPIQTRVMKGFKFTF